MAHTHTLVGETDTHTHTESCNKKSHPGEAQVATWQERKRKEEAGQLEAAFVMAQVVRAVNLRTSMMMTAMLIMMKLNRTVSCR